MYRLISLYVIWVTSLLAQVPSYTVSTIVGTNPSGDNGRARDARLFRTEGIVADAQGNLYFCERGNSRVRRVGRDQNITTIAGGGDIFPEDGKQATTVRLYDPVGITLNPTANILYFSDSTASIVYSVDLATGLLGIVAGTGASGASGDGGAARRAALNAPRGLAYDATLGLLIADTANHRIRRVNLTNGVISAFAGSGSRGFSGDGAAAIAGQLSAPYGVAVAADRTVYIADYGNSRIRRVRTDGNMDTVAGNGRTTFAGDGGLALSAAVDGYSVAIAPDGTLYLGESNFQRVRKITPEGVISTIAGTGSYGFTGDGGIATVARLDSPHGVALDTSGSLYIADSSNHRIRRITLGNNIIDTFAGRNRFGGEAIQASLALLTAPQDVAYDAAGNLYFADTGNHCVRKVAVDGTITTVAGVGGEAGAGAENVAANTSRLALPSGVAVDADGVLYIADRGNLRVRRVDTAGMIRTISGSDFYVPQGVAVNNQQRKLYFTDDFFNQVLSIDLTSGVSVPVVVAGSPSGRSGFTGDGGPATSATLRGPEGIALAPNGDIYFVDGDNLRLRKIDGSGVITTVAGNGEIELTPTDGPITSAILSLPRRVAIDAQNNIFISESLNRIRRISGTRIDTIAGQFSSGFSGDGGAALQAKFDGPVGLAVAGGSVMVADAFNHRLRRLTVGTPNPPPVVASKLEIRSGNNQSAATGQLLPQALTVAVLSASNQPVPATAVTFAVTAGTATVSAASVNTGTDGQATVTVTLGATAGAVQVTARSGTLTPVVFNLTATTAGPPPVTVVRPVISRGGILGVGLSVPAVTTIAPRSIATIFGQNFLEAGVTGRRVDFVTESVNGLLPTRLLGVCVEIGGIRAPMLDVFGTQLNVVVPAVTGTSVAVRVIRRCDQADAAISDPETVPVAAVAPEFLYSQLNQDGRNPVAAVNAVTGALIGPATLAGFVPAQSGDILTIYATGFGATDPAIVAGGTSAGIASVTASVRVTIGDVDLAPADVLYVGASPSSLIYQVNLRVPAGLANGNLPVRIYLNGVASPPNAYLAITGAGASVAAPSLEQRFLEVMKARAAAMKEETSRQK